MKKVIGFVLSIFPIFVIVLLFVTGLMAKNFTDIMVRRIEMINDSIQVKKENDGQLEDKSLMNNINVIPASATDPTVYYTSDDENIASVEKTTGKLTCKNYGTVTINAVAKQNPLAKANCKVEVWDDKIHQIQVLNQEQALFLGTYDQCQLQVQTIPSNHIKDSRLNYVLVDDQDKPISPDQAEISSNGLIVTHTNKPIDCFAKISSVANPQAVTKTKISINDGLKQISFKNPGLTVTEETKYDLSNEIVTYPTQLPKTIKVQYTSSDPTNAPINESGVIEFKNTYVPSTPVTVFASIFNGGLIASKTISSTMKYCQDISFDKYEYKIENFESTKDITDDLSYRVYPSTYNKNNVIIESSDTNVVKIENHKILAVGAGSTTITIKALCNAKDYVVDKCEVYVLPKNKTIFKTTTNNSLDIGETYCYPIRKSLSTYYEDKKINWSIDSTCAVLDEEHEVVCFKNKGEATITAEVDDKSDKIKLVCSNEKIDTVEVVKSLIQNTYTIKAGQKVQFSLDGEIIKPKFNEYSKCFEKVDTDGKIFVAKQGSEVKFTVQDEDENNLFDLIIAQDPVSIKWVNEAEAYNNKHLVTDKKTIGFSTNMFTCYPSTATRVVEGLLSIDAEKIEPTIKITGDDMSAFSYEDNKIEFSKPATVTTTISANDASKVLTIKSTCGHNGKFNLIYNSKVYQSSDLLTATPNQEITLSVNEFVNTVEELDLTKYSTWTLSGNNDIISSVKIDKKDNKPTFTFKTLSSGNDGIVISNGVFEFILNINVDNKISNIKLYCQGEEVQKTINESTPIYNKTYSDSLFLNISPDVITGKKFKYQYNGGAWTECSATITIDKFDEGQNNKLVVSDEDGTISSTYYFNYVKSAPESFEIIEAKKENDKNYLYLHANQTSVTCTIKLDGLVNYSYLTDKLTIDGQKPFIYAKTAIFTIDAPTLEKLEYEKDIQIKLGNISNSYHISRDMVKDIYFPKHTLEDDLTHGLQRVHVFGNKTKPAGKPTQDYYNLPIELTRFDGEKITNKDLKEKIINQYLRKTLVHLTSAEYDKESDSLRVKFDPNYLYTPQEIFNNAFANKDTNKDQIISLTTNYGYYNPISSANATYSFVTVDGINVYDQDGIRENFNKNIVLQTNFGPEPGKETAKFDLTGYMSFESIYGNGYEINFDTTSKIVSKTDIMVSNMLNTNCVGCNEETFKGVHENRATIANPGVATSEEKPYLRGYNSFTKFFVACTVWRPENVSTVWINMKNCIWYNDSEGSLAAITEGNPDIVLTIQDCSFFNAGKISISAFSFSTLRLKGNINFYNFHAEEMLDAIPGISESAKKTLYNEIVLPILKEADGVQGEEYGSHKEVANMSLLIMLGTTVQFFDGKDASGKDIWKESDRGSELAANYLRKTVGIPKLAEVWITARPALPVAKNHAPAYFDEFVDDHFNYDTFNKLIESILRPII